MRNVVSGRSRTQWFAGLLLPVVAATLTMSACNSRDEQDDVGDGGFVTAIDASKFAKIAETHENSSLGDVKNLAEGPSFGPDGGLYVTDVAAPGGEPKVRKLDLNTQEWTDVYTDEGGIYSSAQFSPRDSKLYLTDMRGKVIRMKPDGSEVETVFDGPVNDRTMVADDIAFDREGNMYVTDLSGSPWDPTGRLIRIAFSGGTASVLQDGLATPNGVAFTPDYSRLWANESSANRLINFCLSEDGTNVVDGRVGLYGDLGTKAGGDSTMAYDSITIDSGGNIYQAVYGRGEILVWNAGGDLIATVRMQDEFSSNPLGVTNVAIKPGTKEAFATVGADDGSYLYQFEALGDGVN